MPAENFVHCNDLNIHFLREGTGRPLLLLHGWPDFCRTWKKNIPVLAKNFEVIAPDIRGFGKTQADAQKDNLISDPALLAADLLALLDKLDIEKAGIVSYDVGAWIARRIAQDHPERVAGLFFFNLFYEGIGNRFATFENTAATWYQHFHRLPLAETLVGHSRDTCRIYFQHFLSHWAYDPHCFDTDIEEWVDNFMQPGVLASGFSWYEATAKFRAKLIKEPPAPISPITVPTRVLWGANDPILKPEWRHGLEDYFTNLDVGLAPKAGHFVHYEQPDLANTEILAFFHKRDW